MTRLQANKATDLLVIDQAPLLGSALEAYREALQRVESFKSELAAHEARVMPAYERWYHSTFGASLTRIRETAAAILSQEKLLIVLRKRHWNRFFADSCLHPEHEGGATRVFDEEEGQGSYRVFEGEEERKRDARSRVREAVGDESGDGEEGFEFTGSVHGAEREFYDDEQDFADEESGAAWFESLFNRDYKRGGAYRRREGTGGAEPGDRDGRRAGGAGGPGDAGGGADESHQAGLAAKAELIASRVKDRYRLLVKRLHPDLNPELSQEHRDLWVRVQRAYGAHDLEELDLLMALSGALSGSVADSTSLYHLRILVREVERIAAPLRMRVDEVRCSRAWKWKFGESQQRVILQRNIEQELARELGGLRARLAEIATQIARFTVKKPAARSRDDEGAEPARPRARV
jgi:hypothetical protein